METMEDESRRSPASDRTDALVAGARVLSKKWNVAIVGLIAAEGPQGFSDLEERLDGVSAKVLSDGLESLQDHEVVERRVLSESPLRVEYDLTRSGAALAPVVDDLESWAESHLIEEDPTVLVADDDPRVADMHADWIAGHYDVVTATSPEDARALAEDGADLVVVDRRMTTDGVAITDELGERADAPVLVLSSLDPDFEVLDGRCDAYIQKPTDPSSLVDSVDTLLGRRDLPPSVREYLSLRSLRETLRQSSSRHQQDESERYGRLEARIHRLEERIDDDRLGTLTDRAVSESA